MVRTYRSCITKRPSYELAVRLAMIGVDGTWMWSNRAVMVLDTRTFLRGAALTDAACYPP